MRQLPRSWFHWLFLASVGWYSQLVFAEKPAGEIRGIVIGEREAWVREFRRLVLAEGEQEVDLEGIPEEVDLGTLQLYAPRAQLKILEWTRERKKVRCRLQSGISAPKTGVDVIYALTGLTWSATYDVTIRSDPTNIGRSAVSADFTCFAHIRNDTGTDFADVVLRLITSEAAEPERKAIGLLLMDRSNPLNDLWFPSPPEPGVPYAYDLAQPVSLFAGRTAHIMMVKQTRIPAARRYVLRSAAFPWDAKDFRPLRDTIVFPYQTPPGVQPRMALPPGRARVVWGLRKEHIVQAHIHRVALGEEIRIDAGLSPEVSGQRARVRVSKPATGERIETREIRVRNSSPDEAVVEIEEQIDVAGQWSVLSCSVPYVEHMNRLLMQLIVPAGEEGRVVYRLRVRELRL